MQGLDVPAAGQLHVIRGRILEIRVILLPYPSMKSPALSSKDAKDSACELESGVKGARGRAFILTLDSTSQLR